jgi:EmrB/QacA subfamily drug resistance transporter
VWQHSAKISSLRTIAKKQVSSSFLSLHNLRKARMNSLNLTKKQWITLVLMVVGAFVTILNQTLVTPALPTIMTDTGVDASTVQWLTTGFSLVNAIMIPIAAYLQDRFSIKALLMASLGTFCVGTLICAMAPNFGVLLAGRLIQAAGAGVMMPMCMTVLLMTFPVERRGSAMGVFGLVIAFAPAVGPTVGGFMVDTLSWHVMFFCVAALVACVLVLAAIIMDAQPKDKNEIPHLDVPSLALSTLGFGGMLYGFSAIGSSGFTPLAGIFMVVGAVCVVVFFRRQLKLDQPFLRVDVLFNRSFLISTIIGMLIQGSLLAASVLVPIYVQNLLGLSATMSGLIMMPGAILMGIMNPISGRLFDKHGARTLSIVGISLLVISTVGMGLLRLDTSLVFLVVIYTIRQFSMSMVNMPINTWGMNALDTKLMNHGTSVNNTLRMVAGSMGCAIVVTVSSLVQGAFESSVGTAQATMYGINAAFMVCAVLAAAGLVLTIKFVKGDPAPAPAATSGAHHSQNAEGVTSAPAAAATPKDGASDTFANAGKDAFELANIMRSDVFTLPQDATVLDAMRLFTDRGISAAPIVDRAGQPVGFISDGDILKCLSSQTGTFVDPIALIMASASDNSEFSEKLEHIVSQPALNVGVHKSIGVDVNTDLREVCRILSSNHLKKVPVLSGGRIVGVVNRSDITKYSMEAYLGSCQN